MGSGKYSALAGAISREQAIANISNNLANINTSGFKRSKISFAAILRGEAQIEQAKGINYDRTAVNYNDFSEGAIRQTNDPLNIAIKGDGFLKLQGANGILYTRRGDLAVRNDGTLTTSGGIPVLDEAGTPVSIPQSDIMEIVIAADGTVNVIGRDNTTTAAGKIAVVNIEDTSRLSHISDTTYAVDDPNLEFPAAEYRVVQGALEMSNVNMMAEMSQMIDYHRAYDINHKVIKAYSSIAEKEEELGTLTG